MKKLLLLTTLFLVGCAPTSTPTGPSKEPEVPPSPAEKLFVSEVYASNESTFGKAIELGYIGDFELNLEGYRLQIFSGKTLKKTIAFTSNDVVSPNGTYVIANKTNDVYDYHSKANMILDDDYINLYEIFKFVELFILYLLFSNRHISHLYILLYPLFLPSPASKSVCR